MDDLDKPLGITKPEARPAIGRKLAKFSMLALIGAAVGLGSWVILTENPLGGEPVLITSLQNAPDTVDSRDVAVLQIQENLRENQQPSNSGEVAGAPAASVQGPLATLTELSPVDPSLPTNEDIVIRPVTEGINLIEPRLSHLPDADLIEPSVYGDLPRRGANGAAPSKRYSRPLSASGGFGTARVAIVVGGLGLSQTGTQSAIESLPGAVTLAFAPYGNSLQRWVEKARRDGHELLIQAPMEPFDYPVNDPGPHTLRVDLSIEENRKRLLWVLGRITNYVGVINFMGARYSADRSSMSKLLGELNTRGLLYVDDGSALRTEAMDVASALKMPFVRSALLLDADPDSEQISAQLLKLEQQARDDGVAIATASAFPASVRRISEWVIEAEKRGIDVVPISALAYVGQRTQLGQNSQ